MRDNRGLARWIWAVHLETSTGMLNDVPGLARLAREAGVQLCLDCVSSLFTLERALEKRGGRRSQSHPLRWPDSSRQHRAELNAP